MQNISAILSAKNQILNFLHLIKTLSAKSLNGILYESAITEMEIYRN